MGQSYRKAESLSESYHLSLEELRCPIFVYGGAIFVLPGAFSLVTAVQFSNGQEVLSIVYSGAKYVRSALKIAAAQKALF